MQRVTHEKSAALIVAAGKPTNPEQFDPTQLLGQISVIKRIITTFQKAGIHEIVIITGYGARKLEKHLATTGVICLRNEMWRNNDMFASAKIGFYYLQDKCTQLLFTPVDIPMFSLDTVTQLLSVNHSAAFPIVSGEAGHPLLLKSSVLKKIMNYNGTDGLRGALTLIDDLFPLEVTDHGTLFDLQCTKISPEMFASNMDQPVMPLLSLSLIKEKVFLNEEVFLLLKLINRTHSVRIACQQMNLSYSKGWRLINLMEQQIGARVIQRHQGGKEGGWSELSEYGTVLLERYALLHQQIELIVEKKFKEIFFDIFQ